jgi:hypothetical protein
MTDKKKKPDIEPEEQVEEVAMEGEPEVDQKSEVDALKTQWDVWMASHSGSILNTIALGKTKRVSAGGVEDTKNEMMISSYVQGESLEAVAEMFTDHPHFGIPGATVEIMETRPM